ncbi:hypothetical protein [Burkholderia sp. WTPI3]|uniref:hypothetical protein n=1 Tax=Burkholderia sp. WTPI3 TaxID=2822167 RepID=UPI001F3E06BD|nr:hypothetical protein [Burkholderia sp. WTPI3]
MATIDAKRATRKKAVSMMLRLTGQTGYRVWRRPRAIVSHIVVAVSVDFSGPQNSAAMSCKSERENMRSRWLPGWSGLEVTERVGQGQTPNPSY